MTPSAGGPGPRSRRVRWLVLAASVLVAGALVTGFEVRQRGRERGGVAQRVADPPGLRWELTPGVSGHNPRGFRGADWPDLPTPGRPRVAVVGDSVTYGGTLPAPRAYPAVTGERLRARGVPAEVLNLGVLGYDLVQIQALVEARVWALQPDVLVYGYFTNDHMATTLLNVGQPPFAIPVGEFGISPALLPRALGGGLLRRYSALYRKLEGAHLLRIEPGEEARLLDARAERIDARFDDAWQALSGGARTRGVPLVVLAIPSHVAAAPGTGCERLAGEGYCAEERRRVGGVVDRARADGLPVVDGLAVWKAAGSAPYFPPSDPEDRLHPGEAGHVLLAEALAGVLEAILAPPTATEPSAPAPPPPPS